jgi:hypothetical protein
MQETPAGCRRDKGGQGFRSGMAPPVGGGTRGRSHSGRTEVCRGSRFVIEYHMNVCGHAGLTAPQSSHRIERQRRMQPVPGTPSASMQCEVASR